MHDASSLRRLLYSMHNISMECLCNPEHVLTHARSLARSHALSHARREIAVTDWFTRRAGRKKKVPVCSRFSLFCPLTGESFESSSPLKIRAQSNQPCEPISPISSEATSRSLSLLQTDLTARSLARSLLPGGGDFALASIQALEKAPLVEYKGISKRRYRCCALLTPPLP